MAATGPVKIVMLSDTSFMPDPGRLRNRTALRHSLPDHVDLTPGGAVIARRVKVSASVANLMAEVAGIGEGAVHA